MDYHQTVGSSSPTDPSGGQRDLYTQLVISIAVGLTAFITFCILRPRWAILYAARKRQTNAASSLPELPGTIFGWMPVLYKITEQEVLDSAGLDAYVFLALFRMAIKFLAVACLVVLVIMTPIQVHFKADVPKLPDDGDSGKPDGQPPQVAIPHGFFWMHVVFVYLFTGLIFYLLNKETIQIIKVRQAYLGSQSTITDRTIRLTGIPPELRSEPELKHFIEKLEIGKVKSITLCRDWTELDQLMDQRSYTLRKLEEAWAVHLGRRRVERNLESLPIAQPAPPEPLAAPSSEDETSRLLAAEDANGGNTTPYNKRRPTTRIRFGFLRLHSKKVDAISYYEEKLRRLDDKIKSVRQQDFKPTPLAFVTMDSIAACQMAVQAILDPSPSRLIARLAPAPSDIVWTNTYLSRTSRMTRAWSITIFVGVLTIFWSVLLVPLSALVEFESIKKVLPGLAEALEQHKILKSLVQIGLPTLVLSLLNVAVPYLYDWLSNMQGMISQGEVELSVISKNFFFTFFNLFLLYTVLGSATNLFTPLKRSYYDAGYIANQLAKQLEKFGQFYINLIVLQGIGLLPLRLLEFGSLSLYPILLMGAKTPRDFAELVQPPIFHYGFYLPQTLLIFVICIVYSVLPHGVYILLFGLLYFLIGYFTYKYQLLYAMDHTQHSTGKAWPIISYRVMLGVGVFQVAMFGWLALRQALTPSLVTLPLILITIWFSYYYAQTYEPLTKFISLSSIRRNSLQGRQSRHHVMDNVWREESGQDEEIPDSPTFDEERERGLTFTNPNLISPLEDVWIAKKRVDSLVGENISSEPSSGGDSV